MRSRRQIRSRPQQARRRACRHAGRTRFCGELPGEAIPVGTCAVRSGTPLHHRITCCSAAPMRERAAHQARRVGTRRQRRPRRSIARPGSGPKQVFRLSRIVRICQAPDGTSWIGTEPAARPVAARIRTQCTPRRNDRSAGRCCHARCAVLKHPFRNGSLTNHQPDTKACRYARHSGCVGQPPPGASPVVLQ